MEGVQVNTKQVSGEITERFIHKILSSEGWEQIEAKYSSGKGIDLLYVKRGPRGEIKEVLVVESKYNTSTLGRASYGKQMSKEWILGSLDKKLEEIEKEIKTTKDPYRKRELEKLKKDLTKVKKLIQENRYRARIYKLEKLSENRYVLKRKIIPPGATEEAMKTLNNSFEVVKEIDLKRNDKLSKILKETIEETYSERLLKAINQPRHLRYITVEMPVKGFKTETTEKVVRSLRTLKVASVGKGVLEAIPIIGGFLAAGAQVAYDIALANTIERLAKEQEILGKKVALLEEQQYATQIFLKAIKVRQDEIITKVNTLSNGLNMVRNQIEEIKKGIFISGLELLRDYYITGNKDYLSQAIGQLVTARNVKNPKLEPFIAFYLTNARAETYKLTGNDKELLLLREEFKKLAYVTDKNNINLLFTAYRLLGDIPLEGKEEILRTATTKVVNNLIKEKRFETALNIAKAYFSFTGDKSLVSFAEEERKKNYLAYKNFRSPEEALKVIEGNENSLLVKEAFNYLFRNNYFRLALEVLSKYPLDESFRITGYLAVFYATGEFQRAEALIKLVKENPTYSFRTKKAVMEFENHIKQKLLFEEVEERKGNNFFSL
ncbi:hypothetical protein JCM9492_01650 [Aquifex pyrophilus]